MTRCLFIMEDWSLLGGTMGGASALINSHLELLMKGVEQVAVVILSNPLNHGGLKAVQENQPENEKSVFSSSSKVHILDIVPNTNLKSSLYRLIRSFFEPALYSYGDLLNSRSREMLGRLIEEIAPNFIWAEHLTPATLAQKTTHGYPVIYSHHDWRWKIKTHRSGQETLKLKERMKFWFSKRHETDLVRHVQGCVSGSKTELDEMYVLGARKLGYFPTTYSPIELVSSSAPTPPRIVHLGGMQTTANRLGLLRFLQVCWPELRQSVFPEPELWVIGSLDGATPELRSALQQTNIVCTGFLSDLSKVLRPFDVHIVPWEYNTGTRTRIPLILNHGQVLIGTHAATSCLPELKSGHNCELVTNLNEMSGVVRDLWQDVAKREYLARRGHATFMESFTRESQQSRFNEFVQGIF